MVKFRFNNYELDICSFIPFQAFLRLLKKSSTFRKIGPCCLGVEMPGASAPIYQINMGGRP